MTERRRTFFPDFIVVNLNTPFTAIVASVSAMLVFADLSSVVKTAKALLSGSYRHAKGGLHALFV